MFSFFKRAKKEPGESGTSPKEKRVKDKAKDSAAVASKPDSTVSMCKNNSGQRTESVETSPKSASSESRLPEIASGNAVVTAKSEHSEPNVISNFPSDVAMESRRSLPISYANVVSKPSRSGVKPCGHGTVAIAPKVPDFVGKRELCTPPSSPEMGSQPKYSKVGTRAASNDLDNAANTVHLKQNGLASDTVRGALKLQFEVPKNVANKFCGDANQYGGANHSHEDMYVDIYVANSSIVQYAYVIVRQLKLELTADYYLETKRVRKC